MGQLQRNYPLTPQASAPSQRLPQCPNTSAQTPGRVAVFIADGILQSIGDPSSLRFAENINRYFTSGLRLIQTLRYVGADCTTVCLITALQSSRGDGIHACGESTITECNRHWNQHGTKHKGTIQILDLPDKPGYRSVSLAIAIALLVSRTVGHTKQQTTSSRAPWMTCGLGTVRVGRAQKRKAGYKGGAKGVPGDPPAIRTWPLSAQPANLI